VWIINKNKKQNMTYKEVKRWIKALVLILTMPFFYSCNNGDVALVGNWIRLSDFDGIPRSDAVGFSIGNKGYLGTGYDGDDRHTDFWEYDVTRNSWTQKADIPGVARNGAIGFGTDTKGYLGLGYDGKNKLKDFYEYDPASNTWTQKADFGGTARYGAVAMTISNKGFVGTGYDGVYLKDIWQYDPSNDTWTQKASIGGSKRRDAACFVINGKGYILTGIDNGSYLTDFWEYDPGADLWAKKRAIDNLSDESYDDKYSTIKGICKVGFTVNGKGYLATGGQTTGIETWEYNPSTDLWIEKTSFEGTIRQDAVGFGIATRGYILTGKSSSYYFDDIWGFDPDATANTKD
jgi:N-acetylneuraminic acid mutarotase